MRVPVPLRSAWKLINHGPTTLISTAADGAANVMAAAWVMGLDFEPPKVGAVIAADTRTRQLVEASAEFTVSVPTRAQVDLTYAVGSVSGRDVDKLARYGIATAAPSVVRAPLIEGCAAWLECRVIDEPGLAARYDLFIAEVVAAWADDALFREGTWQFEDDAQRTIHHLSRGVFFTTGERVDAAPLR